MKKKILLGLLTIVVCLILVGCGKEETSNNRETNNDATEQKDNSNNSTLGVGKYKVEKGNNNITVITNDGSGISTTTYYFTGDKITSATLVNEYDSKNVAETSYNSMKNESAIMNQYSNIKLDGKKVILTVKSEVLSTYNTLNYDEFYDLMYSTYEVYMN